MLLQLESKHINEIINFFKNKEVMNIFSDVSYSKNEISELRIRSGLFEFKLVFLAEIVNESIRKLCCFQLPDMESNSNVITLRCFISLDILPDNNIDFINSCTNYVFNNFSQTKIGLHVTESDGTSVKQFEFENEMIYPSKTIHNESVIYLSKERKLS